MSETPTPEHECPGCHAGDYPGFDHYMDWLEVNGWVGVDPGLAFGAWLANTLPGWDGKIERIKRTPRNGCEGG